MPRRLQIKLRPAVVTPLVELIRRMLPEIDPHCSSRELSAVVDLFSPDYAHTGIIHIESDEQRPVLIGCTILRFHLRRTSLAAIPDQVFESGFDLEAGDDATKAAVMCYLFLATLQTIIIESRLPRAPVPAMLTRSILALGRGARHLFRRRSPAPQTSETIETSQVVVLNDPINLMAYVTFVFQTELAMDADTATRHMREVHENKRSIVWTGPRRTAEHLALRLRQWQLTAEVEARTNTEA